MLELIDINDNTLSLNLGAMGDSLNGMQTFQVGHQFDMTDKGGQGLLQFGTTTLLGDMGKKSQIANVKFISFGGDFLGDGKSGVDGGMFEQVSGSANAGKGGTSFLSSQMQAMGEFKFGNKSGGGWQAIGLDQGGISSSGPFSLDFSRTLRLEN